VADGGQMTIRLSLYGHLAKTVVLQNYYQKNLNHLFNLVNRLLLPGLAISCRKKN
jgi:RNAse (barnase) inhibitor barstar